MSRLSVTTPSDREIVLRRDFQAPSRLVFRALTEPDLLRRWYGAQGWHLVVCEVESGMGKVWPRPVEDDAGVSSCVAFAPDGKTL